MLKAPCSQVLSSFWEWDTRIAPSLLAHGNDDQSAKVSPTHDGFPETTIRIWLRKRHLINKLSLMYQPPTPTSFGMVLQRAWKSRTFSQFWVWENNYSLFKKKNWFSAHNSWLKQSNMDRRGEFSKATFSVCPGMNWKAHRDPGSQVHGGIPHQWHLILAGDSQWI